MDRKNINKVDIEGNLIALLIKNPQLIYDISISKEYFSDEDGMSQNRALFSIMEYLAETRDMEDLDFDPQTISTLCYKDDALASALNKVFKTKAETIKYLKSLKDFDVSEKNIDLYEEELIKSRLTNQLLDKNKEVVDDILSNYEDYSKSQIVDMMEEAVLQVGNKFSNKEDNMQHIGDGTLEMYLNREPSENDFVGLPTPWKILNERTKGVLRPGDVTIFAAQTGVGKSIALKNIAKFLSIDLGKKVYFGFNEMEFKQQKDRLMAEVTPSYIEIDDIVKGTYNKPGYDKMHKDVMMSADKMSKSNMFLDQIRNFSPEQLVRRAKYFKKRYDIDIFIFDYVKLSGGKPFGEENRHYLGRIVNMMKENIADPLGIPVLTAVQSKTYEYYMPAESEDIKRYCTNFIAIDKKDEDDFKKNPLGGRYKYFIGKARNGGEHGDPKADGIEMEFNKKSLKFHEA